MILYRILNLKPTTELNQNVTQNPQVSAECEDLKGVVDHQLSQFSTMSSVCPHGDLTTPAVRTPTCRMQPLFMCTLALGIDQSQLGPATVCPILDQVTECFDNFDDWEHCKDKSPRVMSGVGEGGLYWLQQLDGLVKNCKWPEVE